MGAGRLRDRCAFQKEQNTADGAGGNATTWQTQFTVSGQMIHGATREDREAGRLEASAKWRLKVRSSTDTRTVTAEWRVLIKGVPYQIRSLGINRDRRDRWLWFDLEEGVAQ